MAVHKRTCLSAGIVIREILTANDAVRKITQKVFPVVADKAVLPYVAYRRTQLSTESVKNGMPADTTFMEVICYAGSYNESVDLAEAVRDALDCRQYSSDTGLLMRSCRLTDSEEGWLNDAYMQQLIFEVKI